MKIIKMLSKNKNRYWGVNQKKYITIHETGNTNRGANALNHARYINNGSKATWHYTVDDKQIIQHFEDDVQCWHAGDGKGTGNLHSIGIELCVNSDGDFNKTVKNAVELVKYLMKKYNIPINRVVQHNKWSGKNCPQNLRSGAKGITWDMFISMISDGKTTSKTTGKIDNGKIDIDDLAIRTIRGEFGNGEERRKKLGKYYNDVQKRVNELLKSKTSKTTSKTTGKIDIDDLAIRTIRGEFGNGEERRKKLGKYYNDVQKRVNELLKSKRY